ASSHLLINEERREIAFLPSPRAELSTFFPASSEMEQESDFLSLNPIEDSLFIAEKTASDDTDLQHPLYLQLKASHQERKHALNAISREMVELLNQQNNALL